MMSNFKNMIIFFTFFVIIFEKFCSTSSEGLSSVALTEDSSTDTIPNNPSETILSKLAPNHPLYSYKANDRWCFHDIIGSGGFGKVYLGIDVVNGERVAIKVGDSAEQADNEFRVACKMNGFDGFSTIHYWGRNQSMNKHFLVMKLLGPDCFNLFDMCNGKFSLKSVLSMADQMIERLQVLHENHYIHRDIKPENFAIGLGECRNKIYLLDFGFCLEYRQPVHPHHHIASSHVRKFFGSIYYASLNAQNGMQQSRRDDLESLGYVFIFFLKGILPWQYDPLTSTSSMVFEKKSGTSIYSLCSGVPIEFRQYLEHVRNLSFSENPDYNYLRGLFQRHPDFDPSTEFDWCINPQAQEDTKSRT